MKLIIAGSRTLVTTPATTYNLISQLGIDIDLDNVTEIVSGTAEGIDRCGENFGLRYNIEVKRFPADWNKHGKAAGHIRNKQMADYADALLLIWDGESRGSANMKENMLKLKKPVYEVILKKHNITVDNQEDFG